MATNGNTFLDRILKIVKDETCDEKPLIEFRHPKDLEKLLDLDVSSPTEDNQLERCVRQVLQYSVRTGKPSFRNQLYGGTDPYGLAGAWIAEAFNTSQYTYEVAPAFTLVENQMVKHMLRVFGLPADGDGIFSPGGSISNMYAIVVARYKAFPEIKTKGMSALPTLVIYSSDDSHYSIRKGAHWLGLGTDNIVFIKTNSKGQMISKDLELAIQKTKDEGNFPLMVNATAGTTVLGAIDDLEAIADICADFGVWMHVDACWGGSLILSEKYKSRLYGIERAQSISWNPHKMAGAPLQCSAFLVRESGLLHEANAAAAHYLFQQDKFYDVRYDTGDKSVQCGRKVDAFKLWLMWKARGDSGLGALVERAVETAECCQRALAGRAGFRLVGGRLQCPNVCFWYIPKFMRGQEETAQWWEKMHKVTPKIKELLTLSSEMMISYTPLGERRNFFRMAVTCHPPVTKQDIFELLESIESCGETVTEDMISV